MRKLFAIVFLAAFLTLPVLAGETMLPNRLASAEVGEWVLYQLPGGFTQRHIVVERTGEGEDANITIKVDDILDGKVTQTHEVTEIAGKPMAPMPHLKDPGTTAVVREETVQVKGKSFKCVAVDIKKGNDVLRTWYVSPEFPVYGLVKRTEVKGKEPSFEAVDFKK